MFANHKTRIIAQKHQAKIASKFLNIFIFIIKINNSFDKYNKLKII